MYILGAVGVGIAFLQVKWGTTEEYWKFDRGTNGLCTSVSAGRDDVHLLSLSKPKGRSVLMVETL